jgi:hypothetical protein
MNKTKTDALEAKVVGLRTNAAALFVKANALCAEAKCLHRRRRRLGAAADDAAVAQ